MWNLQRIILTSVGSFSLSVAAEEEGHKFCVKHEKECCSWPHPYSSHLHMKSDFSGRQENSGTELTERQQKRKIERLGFDPLVNNE